MKIKSSASQLSRTALVTGGVGFIGHHLVNRLLNDGWIVHAVIRKSSNKNHILKNKNLLFYYDDCDTESLGHYMSEVQPSVIFHLASNFLAEHKAKDIEDLVESNISFGTRVLDAMRLSGSKCIVNTGTSWQHYKGESYNPVCLYAAMKEAYEAIIEYYRQAHDFKVITLKLFDTYGPGDQRLKLFNLLRQSSLSNVTLEMSPGEQKIDLVHVEDVVEAYLIAANKLMQENLMRHEVYAVSSMQPISLKELVELYSLVLNKKININWGGREYRGREVMTPWDGGAILKGWAPKISLVDGLRSLERI